MKISEICGTYELLHQCIVDVFLATVYISSVVIYDFAFAIQYKYVRYVLHVHRTFEVAVRVEQHLVLPAKAVNEWLYFVCILCLVDAHDDHLYASLVLPVRIYLMDSLELTQTWLAPGCPEGDDHRFAIVVNGACLYGVTIDVL